MSRELHARGADPALVARIDALAKAERRSRSAMMLVLLERALALRDGVKLDLTPAADYVRERAVILPPVSSERVARIKAPTFPDPVKGPAVHLGPVPPKPGARLKPSKGKA